MPPDLHTCSAVIPGLDPGIHLPLQATEARHLRSDRSNLICQSTKTACDALLQEYMLLDEQMKESIRKEHVQAPNS